MPKADRERGIFSNLCSSPHGLAMGCTHEKYLYATIAMASTSANSNDTVTKNGVQ